MDVKSIDHLEFLQFLEKVTLVSEKRSSRLEYGCIEAFVLAKGQWFKDISTQPVKRGRMKECFQNAFYLAEEKGWRYVEGYAAGLLPVLHGWCLNKEGHVVDPSWDDGRWYYGVVIPMKYVYVMQLKRKKWGILDAWDIGFPLLTGEHRLENYG